MKLRNFTTLLFGATILAACTLSSEDDGASAAALADPPVPASAIQSPSDVTFSEDAELPAAVNDNHGIDYHGGAIMSGRTKIFYIWYGPVSSETKDILRHFARNVGGSPYYGLNTLYSDKQGASVKNDVVFGGDAEVKESLGKSLSDDDVYETVRNALRGGLLEASAHGVYFVIPAKGVNAPNMCTDFCGWHTAARMLTKDATYFKYALIGNPANCPTSCEAQTAHSPNGDPAADAMVSLVAHELDEAVTDPRPWTAWWNQLPKGREENADKCAWKFPDSHKLRNGSFANVKLGDRQYLIQANWLNSGSGACRMHE